VGFLANDARFLLWAMRAWADSIAKRQCAPQTLLPGFTAMRSQSALVPFHMVSALLNQHAREQLGIAPVACQTIAESEAVLLSVWQALALARFELADATISLLVEDQVAPRIRRVFAATSGQFALAGLDHSRMTLEESEA
jgi:hypothetical protein